MLGLVIPPAETLEIEFICLREESTLDRLTSGRKPNEGSVDSGAPLLFFKLV